MSMHPMISDRIAQARPIEFVISNAVHQHQQLDGFCPASDIDLGCTVSGTELKRSAGRLDWIRLIRTYLIHQSVHSIGIAVVEISGYREDIVRGPSRDGDD